MTRKENLHWLNEEIRTWENECQSKHPIKEALYMACKALERELNTWSLDDAREDFMHDVYNELDFLPTNEEANRIIDIFDRVTSSIEQEPRKGHWKHIQYEETLCCSECGCQLVDEQTYIPLHYCPNCGADMREVQEDGKA